MSKVATVTNTLYACQECTNAIGPLHDPVTWYGINYAEMQVTQWDLKNKGKLGWTGRSSFVWKSHCIICVPA